MSQKKPVKKSRAPVTAPANQPPGSVSKPRLIVIEQLRRTTGAKHYMAFDENFKLLAEEHRLDRITKTVQKMLEIFDWDFTLQKVDGNWVPPMVDDLAQTDDGNAESEVNTVRFDAVLAAAASDLSKAALVDFEQSCIVKLETSQWLHMVSHPSMQKDRIEQMAAARRQQLTTTRACMERMRFVYAANLHNVCYKLDGHVRALMWERGMLPAPQSVVVTLIDVADEIELGLLRRAFDASVSAEDGAATMPQVMDADSIAAMDLVTIPTALRGPLRDALQIVLHGTADNSAASSGRLVEAATVFAPELRLITQLPMTMPILQSGVLAAAILAVSRRADDLPFFAAIIRAISSGTRDVSPAVQTVVSILLANNPGKRRRAADAARLCAQVLMACEEWRAGQCHDAQEELQVEPFLLESYVDAVRSLKGLT